MDIFDARDRYDVLEKTQGSSLKKGDVIVYDYENDPYTYKIDGGKAKLLTQSRRSINEVNAIDLQEFKIRPDRAYVRLTIEEI